ncbi:MAG: peptidylprolyl isomerase [Desulfobacterales bacterium]|nr:peptidylprolyl isomerase [Desulfobacterales bacterium]
MKRMFVALLCAGMLFAPSLLKAALVDRVVAVVNDEPITLSELNAEGKDFFQQIIEKTPPAELEGALTRARREVLSSLINQRIAAQKAAELGVEVSEQEVDEAYDKVVSGNRMSRREFQRQLAASGRSEQGPRPAIRAQILRSKLVSMEVRSRIVITDEKAREYYDHRYGPDRVSTGYHLLQMGFSWNKGARPADLGAEELAAAKAEARQRAEQVRAQAVAGGNFRELAKAYSDLPSAAEGGDIGTFKQDDMAPHMRETITELKPGEISPLVEIGSGYQFFKLLSTEAGEVAPFESVREEIRDLLYQQELEKQYEKWLKELREQAYIQELL